MLSHDPLKIIPLRESNFYGCVTRMGWDESVMDGHPMAYIPQLGSKFLNLIMVLTVLFAASRKPDTCNDLILHKLFFSMVNRFYVVRLAFTRGDLQNQHKNISDEKLQPARPLKFTGAAALVLQLIVNFG